MENWSWDEKAMEAAGDRSTDVVRSGVPSAPHAAKGEQEYLWCYTSKLGEFNQQSLALLWKKGKSLWGIYLTYLLSQSGFCQEVLKLITSSICVKEIM